MNTKARPIHHQVMINMVKLGASFLAGLAVAVFLLLALGLVSQAFGADAVPTYDASLGEQDRSFNYPMDSVVYPVVAAESGWSIWYDAMDEAEKVQDMLRCDEHNRYNIAVVKMIAANIANDPVNGHFYRDTLIGIHDNWCTG